MQIVLLDADTLGKDVSLEPLKALGDLLVFGNSNLENIVERSYQSQIIITNKVIIDAQIMNQLPNLKLICVAATGMNNIDLIHAAKKHIAVKNVSNYSTDSVAQQTFALLLSLMNSTFYYDSYVKAGHYAQSNIFTNLESPFSELAEKKMGIIGLGNIGRKVAQIAQAFGMEVCYASLTGIKRNEAIEEISLEKLITSSDVISIHSPLNEYSKNLVDLAFLKKMKPTAILLNIGRGGIVVESDLAEALHQNMIKGACVDVFEQEPIKSDNPLLSPNIAHKLVLSPHIAWSSIEARNRLVKQIAINIENFMKSS